MKQSKPANRKRPVMRIPGPPPLPKAYSGEGSEQFWKRVNALPEKVRWELYACGVLLQETESRVLGWLHAAEVAAAIARSRSRKKTKRKP